MLQKNEKKRKEDNTFMTNIVLALLGRNETRKIVKITPICHLDFEILSHKTFVANAQPLGHIVAKNNPTTHVLS